MKDSVNITSLREGDQGIIDSVEGDPAMTSHLAAMGIVTNARFRIAQVSGGRIIIQVADTSIALTRRSLHNNGH